MKKIILIFLFPLIGTTGFSQWQSNGSLNDGSIGNTLGTYNNYPINIYTNSALRMHINQSGTSAYGAPTGGFVGVGTNAPGAPLHIAGSQIQNAQGWKRGLMLSNGAAIHWHNATAAGFFLAHPSNSPSGNFFAGSAANSSPGAAVDYAFSVYVNDNLGTVNPLRSTQFYKNVIIESSNVNNQLAVNTLNPTDNLDINGTARIRNVQQETPDALFVGVQSIGAGTPEDLKMRRLDFPNDNTQVLLGDGTWGTINNPPPPANITALDGCRKQGNSIRLGDRYLPVPNNNHPLLGNRQLRLNSHNFIFSGAGMVGIGMNWPIQPTEVLDVKGNGRFEDVPVQGGQSILLGLQNGANANDVELSRLEFSNNPSEVLLGTGVWGTIPTGGLGALCGTGAGDLSGDSYIGLNTHYFYFEGNANNERVGVGYDCGEFLLAKMNVRSSSLGPNVGVFSEVSSNALINYGGAFRVFGASDNNTGVYGAGSGGFEAVGGYFYAQTDIDRAYGVKGYATNAPKYNFGVYGFADNNNGSYQPLNIGVYGEAKSTAYGTNYAGYFAGTLVSGNYPSQPSDIQFKENIVGLSNASTIINNLNPVQFEFMDTGNAQYLNFEDGVQPGLIAQEVELVLPEIVMNVTHPAKYDSLENVVQNEFDYKTVSYTKLIPYLIAGMQEQQAMIDSLQLNSGINYQAQIDSLQASNDDLNDRLTTLENCLANILPALCNANNHAPEQTPAEIQEELHSVLDVELRNGNNIVLNQNVPNPFAERTTITYTIPESVGKAQIHFYDATGVLINTVEIIERGNGIINVYAADLSSGMYTYSLVADGKIVATKKMVKE